MRERKGRWGQGRSPISDQGTWTCSCECDDVIAGVGTGKKADKRGGRRSILCSSSLSFIVEVLSDVMSTGAGVLKRSLIPETPILCLESTAAVWQISNQISASAGSANSSKAAWEGNETRENPFKKLLLPPWVLSGRMLLGKGSPIPGDCTQGCTVTPPLSQLLSNAAWSHPSELRVQSVQLGKNNAMCSVLMLSSEQTVERLKPFSKQYIGPPD